MFDKKEYERLRCERKYQDFRERRAAIHIVLGSECYLCKREAEVGFHLHHTHYHEIESDYPRHSKNMHVRFLRLREAELNPERFRLLCPECHSAVGKLEHLSQRIEIDYDKIKELLSA